MGAVQTPWESLHRKLTRGEKSFAALGTWNHVSIAPGFSVGLCQQSYICPKKFYEDVYASDVFFASYLSSSELSQAGSRFTTEGLNETGEQKWALKQKMCHCFPLLAFFASSIDIYALGVLFGAWIWDPQCSVMWVRTVCVLLMNGVYAWKGFVLIWHSCSF